MGSPIDGRGISFALEDADRADEIAVRGAGRCGKGRWKWWLALVIMIVLVIIVSGIGFKVYDAIVPPSPPTVMLCRLVRGAWVGEGTSLAVYRGIPYGQADRWQLPRPAPCWSKTLDSTKPGFVCPQLVPPDAPYVQSEDCLNINIWTGSSRNAKKHLPILFFLHGGSNVVGSSEAYRNLDSFAQSKQLCVFSPNHRIGVFGFLALEELSLQDPRNSSGNYGIEDIKLALKWTKENAHAFGCDASAITLIGQSSGATNVFALLSSAENKGLFQGAIALSGSANITQSLQSAEKIGRQVIINAKCEGADPLKCLRALPMPAVQAAMPAAWASTDFWPTSPSGLTNPGLLTVDGVTIQTDFVTAMTNSLVDVPLYLQTARADLILFPRREIISMDEPHFESLLNSTFRSWPNSSTGIALANAYRASANVSVMRGWAEMMTDITMYCAHVEIATRALHSGKRSSPIYVSVVDQPPGNPVKFAIPDACSSQSKGNASCTSVPFLVKEPCHAWDYMVAARAWSQLTTISAPSPYIPSPLDEKLGDLLKSHWINFAEGLVNLTAFNAGSGYSAHFYVNVQGDTNFSSLATVVPDYRAPFCQLLKDLQLNPDSRFWVVN